MMSSARQKMILMVPTGFRMKSSMRDSRGARRNMANATFLRTPLTRAWTPSIPTRSMHSRGTKMILPIDPYTTVASLVT